MPNILCITYHINISFCKKTVLVLPSVVSVSLFTHASINMEVSAA